jgi:hypothetical protein
VSKNQETTSNASAKVPITNGLELPEGSHAKVGVAEAVVVVDVEAIGAETPNNDRIFFINFFGAAGIS